MRILTYSKAARLAKPLARRRIAFLDAATSFVSLGVIATGSISIVGQRTRQNPGGHSHH